MKATIRLSSLVTTAILAALANNANANNTATYGSSGAGHTANLEQQGTNQSLTAYQHGTNNSVDIKQIHKLPPDAVRWK